MFWKFLDFIAVKVVFLVRVLVLASLLPPEDLGLLAIGVTAVTLLLQLSDFGIVPALIQRPGVTDQDYDTGWTIDLGRAVLVTTILVFAAPWIAGVFGELRATPIIQAPAIVEVVESVAFPVYARLQEMRTKAREFFCAALPGMAMLLIPACLLLVALAPRLVEHVLGERWAGTTTTIQVLALSSPLGPAMYAAPPLLKSFGLPSRVTVFELLQSGLRLALAWILIGRIGLLGTVVTWLIAVLVSQPLGIVYARANLRQPYTGLWRPVVVVSAASIAGALTTAWLDASLPGFPGFLLAAATGRDIRPDPGRQPLPRHRPQPHPPFPGGVALYFQQR